MAGSISLARHHRNSHGLFNHGMSLSHRLFLGGGRLSWAGAGAMHPDLEDKAAEISRLREQGIKGIKLHPMINGFYPDDPKMFPVYGEMGDSMVLEIHCGRLPHAGEPSQKTGRQKTGRQKTSQQKTIRSTPLRSES